MKKISLIFLVFISLNTYAQSTENTSTDTIVSPILAKKNELKLDVLNLTAFGKLGISYERFLNQDFSIGITGMVFNKKSKNDDFLTDDTRTKIDYQVIPYVRYALSKSATNLYYLEGFINVNGGEYKELKTFNNGTADYVLITRNDYNDVALGGAVGYKLYFKESFVLDLTVGLGKNLFQENSPSTVARLGINLGYRF
ncbi:hypothetical protein [Flavobacterium cyclinae]|uniref:hypothetical protein n=1 Tax=Flavobacterium cyclinae TaxID=2895947 RepID=UPI001E2AFBD1|nr:hypothetical protein [Flavobacterium cyclinae]UGS19974.1 hypothetical protein LOS86_08045 [Flavobacterium cyclinae]